MPVHCGVWTKTRPWRTKETDAKPKKSPKKSRLRRLKAMSSSPSKHKDGPSRDVQVDGS